MPNAIGYVDDTVSLANQAFLLYVKNFAVANGWTLMRYDDTIEPRELILRGPGYTGPDGQVYVYVGMRSYQSVPSDYYNLTVAGFTGYVSGNTFATQPGYIEFGVPSHNQRIDYWLTINDRRIAFGLKVGTPVYESAYMGLFLPYATPRQYPYPLAVGGALTTAMPATRYSETGHSFAWKGSRANMVARFVDGFYKTPAIYPWSNGRLAGAQGIRPGGTYYPLPRVVMYDAVGVLGELDGMHYMTGFDNVVENTLVVGGETYIVIQDVWRTGFIDYVALRLDT